MTTLPIPPTPSTSARPTSRTRVALALGARLALFALFQGLVALAFALRGTAAPWAASVAWWPVTATATNLVNLALLRRLVHLEGRRLRDLVRADPRTVRPDLLLALGVLLIGGALATAPNLGLAALLWGDPATPLATFVQPLPLWAAWGALLGFPATIALSELPTYYGYARPRLESLGASPRRAVGLVALVHALQHVTLPLVFDPRFLLWRALMFLPFALFVGEALRRRPTLLPYLMVAHGLLDLSVGAMVLQASLP